MLNKSWFLILVVCLLVWSPLNNITLAQVVDPCWYGCPKDGCPKCETGGPLSVQKHVDSCKKNHRARIADCKSHFPSKKHPVKQKECFTIEKALFDKCMGNVK